MTSSSGSSVIVSNPPAINQSTLTQAALNQAALKKVTSQSILKCVSPAASAKKNVTPKVVSQRSRKDALLAQSPIRAAPSVDKKIWDSTSFQGLALASPVSIQKPTINYCTLPDFGVQAVFLNPTGQNNEDAFNAYKKQVAQFNTPGLMTAEAAFQQVEMTPEPEQQKTVHKPRVGIVFSEWFQLTGESLKNVIDLVKSHDCEPLLILPMADALLFDPATDNTHEADTVRDDGSLAVMRETAEHQTSRLQAISQLNQQLDGIISLGGPDIDPNIYGQKNEDSVHVNKPRDRFDSSLLLDAVLARRLYLFAICRSHQLLNATLGGELAQDMRKGGYSSQSRNQNDYNIPTDAPFQLRDEAGNLIFSHDVDVDANSDLGRIAQTSTLLTNSFHHQVVLTPGKNLKVVGTVFDVKADKRNIEMTESWQITTTQYHPERLLDTEVFENIAATACRRAHIFSGQKQGAWQSQQAVMDWMSAYDGSKPFLPADFDWVQQHYSRLPQ